MYFSRFLFAFGRDSAILIGDTGRECGDDGTEASMAGVPGSASVKFRSSTAISILNQYKYGQGMVISEHGWFHGVVLRGC